MLLQLTAVVPCIGHGIVPLHVGEHTVNIDAW
jgi:hypothetical protein